MTLGRFVAGCLVLSLCLGCSFANKASRPTPGAARNLSCALEYRPDSTHDGPDILFTASADPWKGETFYMSLPDVLIHSVFAPGRHLTEPIRVQGAECESTPWRKGHRLPDHLLCRREGLEAVAFSVETKWGRCDAEIAAGDTTPTCRLRSWPELSESDLQRALARLSEAPCPT